MSKLFAADKIFLVLIWVTRVGLLFAFVGAAIIFSNYVQWKRCLSSAFPIDQQGVGFVHCYYYRGNFEVFLLIIGIGLLLFAFVFRRWKKRT